MNRGLIERLKNAGFPLREARQEQTLDRTTSVVRLDEMWYIIPSLETLIEECVALSKKKGRDGDFHLECLSGRWGATTIWSEDLNDWVRGTTPSEAVARLYLALARLKAGAPFSS